MPNGPASYSSPHYKVEVQESSGQNELHLVIVATGSEKSRRKQICRNMCCSYRIEMVSSSVGTEIH